MENKTVATRSRTSLFDKSWMDRFFNAPLDEFITGKMMNVPAVNVSENDKVFRITIAAPGLDRKDFKIDVADDLLTISAEKTQEKNDQQEHYNRREYNYTSWVRSFYLPENGDDSKVNASYENGELKVTIAKKETKFSKPSARHIDVN